MAAEMSGTSASSLPWLLRELRVVSPRTPPRKQRSRCESIAQGGRRRELGHARRSRRPVAPGGAIPAQLRRAPARPIRRAVPSSPGDSICDGSRHSLERRLAPGPLRLALLHERFGALDTVFRGAKERGEIVLEADAVGQGES